MTPFRRIDSHLHLWNKEADSHRWIEAGSLLDRSFTAAEAEAELSGSGIHEVILVQADQTAEDTDFLLSVARDRSWVAGVVGWAPLTDSELLDRLVESWSAEPAFLGVRQRCDVEERERFGEVPDGALKLLAGRGLTIDLLARGAEGLIQCAEFARRYDGPVVVNHLGRAPIGRPEFAEWHDLLGRIALVPNSFVKFSGLGGWLPPGSTVEPEAVRVAWEAALELFGPSRIMYGGDWPVSTKFAPYHRMMQIAGELIGELSEAEQQQLWAETARAAYRIR